MEYQLKIVNQKKFLGTVIVGILLLVPGMIGLMVITDSVWPLIFFFPFCITLFILSQTFFAQKTNFKIENGTIVLLNRNFKINEIIGYHIDQTISMASFGIKLKSNELIRMTITTSMKWNSNYHDFINDFKSVLKAECPEAKEISFSEFQPRSGKFLKFTVYIGIPIVIIIDLLAVISLFTEHSLLTWQVIPINFLLLSLIPYARNKR